jgi:hypothetical protein
LESFVTRKFSSVQPLFVTKLTLAQRACQTHTACPRTMLGHLTRRSSNT